MSWITQNKFLAGFGIVMLAGVVAFGYLTYSAMDRYNTADTEYQDALKELQRLHEGHPYPEIANREKIVAQKAAYQEKIAAFQKHLADTVLPVETLSPTEFQDKLKETVARVTAKAAGDAHVNLTPEKSAEKFYMGFPEYSQKPPEKTLVPQLSRELAAFESIINLMLAAKNVSILELKRDETKEGAAAAATPRTEKKSIRRSGFTLKFGSSDAAFRSILNGIVGNKEHFFIVRQIAVHNSTQQAPEKKFDAPRPGEAKGSGSFEYIFGTETVVATLDIELLDFAKPEAAPAKSANKPKEAK